MAAGHSFRLSANFCVFLCIYVAFERHRISYSWENTLSDDRETFFISQINCRTEIAAASFRQSQPTHRYEFDRLQKGVMLCKLFQHTCFALTLIALAGDIESNPGYLTFDDIKTTWGLKITHLKFRLFASQGNWQQDHQRTLSETGLDSSTSDVEIKLPGLVCVRQDRIGEKEGYGGVTIYIREGSAFRLRNDINTGSQECLWIELIRVKCKPTLICCAYRAPKADFQTFISAYLMLTW